MKRLINMFLVLSLAVIFLSASAALADDDLEILEIVPQVELGPNAGMGIVGVDSSEFSFSIGPGGYYENVANLADVYPNDYDTYYMTITEATKVCIEVVDCCQMGDTMCLAGARFSIFTKCATSPGNPIYCTRRRLSPGTYAFRAFYTDCPGGFPAGYYVYVTAY